MAGPGTCVRPATAGCSATGTGRSPSRAGAAPTCATSPSSRLKPAVLALALIGCAAAPPPPAPLPPVVDPPMQHARANGIDLAWDSFGDEHAPTVLLIMGIGLQRIAWDEAFCSELAARGFR